MTSSRLETIAAPPRARPHEGCFVCGPANAAGLRIRFEPTAAGRMEGHWTPDARWEGFQGIVHGGIVSTVLDEAMSKAVRHAGLEALTADLEVRFKLAVPSGAPLSIAGWIAGQRKRLIETEASLRSADGVEYAHARGRFLELAKTRRQPEL